MIWKARKTAAFPYDYDASERKLIVRTRAPVARTISLCGALKTFVPLYDGFWLNPRKSQMPFGPAVSPLLPMQAAVPVNSRIGPKQP